ncbi:MAG: hypothetical protein H8F28_10030 [Fibrella sp.]|nr:hypothetical protein [Armatimonadota bacterium]
MRFVAKHVALFAATLSLCSVAHAEPLISAFIGTQTQTSKTAYFVLDFNDPDPGPETYAFGWYYEGAKKAEEFPIALAESLTGANGFQQEFTQFSFGKFFTRFGYNGRAIDSNISMEGFWNLWLGFNGTDWTNSQFGVSDINLSDTPEFSINPFSGTSELSSASWIGFRWNPGDAVAPRTPQQVAVAVPETGTLVLFAAGFSALGVVVRHRRPVKS